jgi:hypothetical protein
MEVLQVSTNHHDEFSILKDTVWKLSSRVLLLEGFIRNQFGKLIEEEFFVDKMHWLIGDRLQQATVVVVGDDDDELLLL